MGQSQQKLKIVGSTTVHIILELVQEKNEKLRRLKFANPKVWLFFSVVYIKRKKSKKRENVRKQFAWQFDLGFCHVIF